jgi:hypothetical protein
MNRRLAFVAVLAPTLALPAVAAENQTTMKVALTDMSSAMGMGPAGRGMMGHSMMQPGQWNDGVWLVRPRPRPDLDIAGSGVDGTRHDDRHDGRSHHSA